MNRCVLSALALVLAITFTACKSSTTDPVDPGTSVPLGTIRMKVDGTLKTYSTPVTIWSGVNDWVQIHAKDPDNIYSDIRIFIKTPKVGDFPVQVLEESGKTRIQLISIVSGNATTTLGSTGVLHVSSMSDSEIAGTLNFESTLGGGSSGPKVIVTEGEFHLSMFKN